MAVIQQDEASRTAHDPPRAIFIRFLRFGALAWGGPAAQIAMIKQECVDEEGWVDEETFKKTLAVYQVLPGPEAHELCVYFGRIRGGKLGGLLAGLGVHAAGLPAHARAVDPVRRYASAAPSSRTFRSPSWRGQHSH
jgi:chromate transporter